MQKKRDTTTAEGPFNNHANNHDVAQLHACEMRMQLKQIWADLKKGLVVPRLPTPTDEWATNGEGHFHLASELFVQVSGWTRFRFPHEALLLNAGEILIVPSKLLHAEVVGRSDNNEPFRSIVIYAEDAVLTSHISYEIRDGENSILHLESGAETQSVQHWLNDAARLYKSAVENKLMGEARELMESQLTGLVMAAIAGTLNSLDRVDKSNDESHYIRLARSRVQNQLGDHQLSVSRLAEEVGCSADHLSRTFHAASGENLVTYINRMRLTRAAHLLRESELATKEIAWSCGFVSQSYFIRRFKEQFGVTPKIWRMQ
jgi:AraC-like DNA-binding protein/mannose-6-phosphate isomerase-like protein (cupin superfamily)